MRRAINILITVAIMVFMAGCSQRKIEDTKPIKIGVDVFPGWGHVFIAEEKGFFKANGVDVEIVLNEEYLTVQRQFADGELDGAFMVYSDAIYASGQGIDVQVVYISDISVSGDVIVARSELTSLEDLRGKTIGVEGINSFSHMFVLTVLEKNGLKETDFFIKNIGAQEIADALQRGDIDAGHTYGPGKSKAKEKGYVPLASAGDVRGMITDILAFHKKTIKMRPKEIQAIIKALFEAKRFQETNRVEALGIIAKAINDTPESVGIGIDGVDYLDMKENAYAMTEEIEEGGDVFSLIESGHIITDFYLKRGQLSSVPDFNEIIESKFVNKLAGARGKSK